MGLWLISNLLACFQVQLDRPVKEQPASSLTATLLARMAEEGTEELTDQVPAPSEPQHSEVTDDDLFVCKCHD